MGSSSGCGSIVFLMVVGFLVALAFGWSVQDAALAAPALPALVPGFVAGVKYVYDWTQKKGWESLVDEP